MEEIIFQGKLKVELQWDLDHHEATLHINGEPLTYQLLEKIMPEYDERHSEGEELGEYIVMFKKVSHEQQSP